MFRTASILVIERKKLDVVFTAALTLTAVVINDCSLPLLLCATIMNLHCVWMV